MHFNLVTSGMWWEMFSFRRKCLLMYDESVDNYGLMEGANEIWNLIAFFTIWFRSSFQKLFFQVLFMRLSSQSLPSFLQIDFDRHGNDEGRNKILTIWIRNMINLDVFLPCSFVLCRNNGMLSSLFMFDAALQTYNFHFALFRVWQSYKNKTKASESEDILPSLGRSFHHCLDIGWSRVDDQFFSKLMISTKVIQDIIVVQTTPMTHRKYQFKGKLLEAEHRSFMATLSCK